MGPGRHFVHYFVRRQRLVNFVAIVEQDTLDRRVLDGPRRRRRRSRGLRRAGTRRSARSCGSVDETYIWALFDRPPLARWSVGAGHPARRRLPPDAAVHGPRRSPGDRGRRDPHRLPRTGRLGRGRRAAPLRAAAPPADVAAPSPVDAPTRPGSTCPTARPAPAATRRWPPNRPTGRSTPSPGSTNTTHPHSTIRSQDEARTVSNSVLRVR